MRKQFSEKIGLWPLKSTTNMTKKKKRLLSSSSLPSHLLSPCPTSLSDSGSLISIPAALPLLLSPPP